MVDRFTPDVIIYTDGGCFNNGILKGNGSWAWCNPEDTKNHVALVHAQACTDSTSNRTEIMAVLNAIKAHPLHTQINIISDSGYVVKGYNDPSYLDTWIQNGWKTSAKQPVMNQDLWNELLILSYRYGLRFTLVRGHKKDPNLTHAMWNSVVDEACTYMIQNYVNTNTKETLLWYNMRVKSNKIKTYEDLTWGSTDNIKFNRSEIIKQ